MSGRNKHMTIVQKGEKRKKNPPLQVWQTPPPSSPTSIYPTFAIAQVNQQKEKKLFFIILIYRLLRVTYTTVKKKFFFAEQ